MSLITETFWNKESFGENTVLHVIWKVRDIWVGLLQVGKIELI